MSILTDLRVRHTKSAIMSAETRCFDAFCWSVATSIACDQLVHVRGQGEPPAPLRIPST
jgi:hypothetical protein